MKMTSEESKEESKEERPTVLAPKNGKPPMIHVSTDVLKEFMSSMAPKDKNTGDRSLPDNDLSDSEIPKLKSASKLASSTNSSVPPAETNGISVPLGKKQISEDEESSDSPDNSSQSKDVPSSERALDSIKVSIGSVNSTLSSSMSVSSVPSKSNSSQKPSTKSSSSRVSDIKPTSNTAIELSSMKDSHTCSTEKKNSEILKNIPLSSSVSVSYSQKPSGKSTSENCTDKTEEKSKNSLESSEKNSASVSSEESSQEEDNILQPGSPLSETSSQLSLEERLLKDDMTDVNDGHESDDFSEEKLLQETEAEKHKGKIEQEKEKDDNSDDANSLHLFDDIGDVSKKATENASSASSENDKEIEKILKDLDDSLKKSGSTDSPSKGSAVNKPKDEDNIDNSIKENSSSLIIDETVSRCKIPDELSKDDSLRSVKNRLTNSVPLSENCDSNKLSQKKKNLPNDCKESNKNNVPFKMFRKNSNENSKETSQDKSDSSKSTSSATATTTSKIKNLTFSEALRSIAMEHQFSSIDKPRPLVPTTEISSSDITPSSLTVLQPLSSVTFTKDTSTSSLSSDSDTANQGRKRSLAESGEPNSPKPDLKKVRVIKEDTENNFKKGDIGRNVEGINLGLIEISRKMEMAKTMESRLQEEKALHEAKNSNEKQLDKGSLVYINKEELERKTAQEIRNASLNNSKLKRIKRKDLESLVIELFVDKVLYEHQLGQQKDLCKRLESTLEANRKKAAQFHKEVEDLKKVTQRLQAEHLTRKSQMVTPVKVKRSVGIQATPTIIGKGLMQASTYGNVRVLSPSTTTSGNQVSQPETNKQTQTPVKVTQQTPTNLTIQPASNLTAAIVPVSNKSTAIQTTQFQPTRVVSTQSLSLSSQPNGSPPTQMVMVNPVVVQQSQNAGVGSPILPVGTTRLVRTPLTPLSSTSFTPSTSFSAASLQPSVPQGGVNTPKAATSGIIDLTDDDDASKAPKATVTTGSVLAIQRPGVSIGQSTSGQFVALNTSSSVRPLVLVPTSLGQPTTTLVVGNVSNSSQTLSNGVTPVRSNVISPITTARFSSPTAIVNTRVVVGAQVNGGSFVSPIPRHPAPLPKAPPQQTSGYSKKLPPVPILKLSQKDNSIVLSWNMAKTDDHERIASYQLYAYQEGTTPPTPTLWKKVGSVKALELPMACTLTQFMPGHVYHFAVRAVDIRSRLGPFSEPRSVRLGK